MSAIQVTIIGDHFMLPATFDEALRRHAAGRVELDIKTHQLPWPDEPMTLRDERYPEVGEFMGDPEQTVDLIGNARVLVNHLAPVTEGMLARLPNLELIGVARGGPINLDQQALARRGIKILSAPGRNDSAVAEFTVGMILCETRRIRVGHEALRMGNWRGDLYRAENTGDELSDLAVGTIGYGRVGRLLMRLLEPFGCRLLAYDPYAACEAPVVGMGLEELLASADVVVLNARVTSETVKIMNRERIAMMKRGALLINPARGPLLDYEALAEALASGALGGAALDTFAEEPAPPDWPLLRLPNLTVTPHIAGASRRVIARAADTIAAKVIAHLSEGRATG